MRRQPSFGFLTSRQLDVLKLRKSGMSYEDIAERYGTTRENVLILEKRALRNLKMAEATIEAALHEGVAYKVRIPVNTRLIDIPSLVVDFADHNAIRLRANFTKIFDDIRYNLPSAVNSSTTIKPIDMYIMMDGSLFYMAA
ncbi:MAG: Tfx family DNA-binding protein [Nitrososphaerota archaeon]|nr:Tfx family DNA-binding protein [Nitrososphaerota archaeon]MDG7049281.1 Tfx family DNA-binding protein [Nitrososphaerota archaeon]MDG7051374.1 Tfx family DNA-binding protein [Nitrososphaerota archaeon]